MASTYTTRLKAVKCGQGCYSRQELQHLRQEVKICSVRYLARSMHSTHVSTILIVARISQIFICKLSTELQKPKSSENQIWSMYIFMHIRLCVFNFSSEI